jgi:hypothetical protein
MFAWAGTGESDRWCSRLFRVPMSGREWQSRRQAPFAVRLVRNDETRCQLSAVMVSNERPCVRLKHRIIRRSRWFRAAADRFGTFSMRTSPRVSCVRRVIVHRPQTSFAPGWQVIAPSIARHRATKITKGPLRAGRLTRTEARGGDDVVSWQRPISLIVFANAVVARARMLSTICTFILMLWSPQRREVIHGR